MRGKRPTFMRHLRAAYRSGLEVAVAAALVAASCLHTYETLKLPFIQPAKARTYTPDFILWNGIVVETKGLFAAEDRAKHLLVKAAHPDLDIRFVFSSPGSKLYKGAKATYADWCDKNGYLFAKKDIPPAWMTEEPNRKSMAALVALGWSLQK